MPLVLRKEANETWKQAAMRHAARNGLEKEVAEAYEAGVALRQDEGNAAWDACYEWDVLDFEP